MTHIPEGAYDREVISVLREALNVAWAKLSRRKPLTVLAIAVAVGLTGAIAVDPQSSGTVAAGVVRGAIDGMILGSNAWPSVPVNVQARLVLWSPDCNAQGQCGWVSTTPIDE
jgi:hypothetical protein